MRLAIVGTAAAAAIGGTLAVAPLTLSTPERVAGGTCSAGQQCDRLAAVLMPDTATPSGPAAAEHACRRRSSRSPTRSRRDWFPWTLRALSAAGNGDAVVQPSGAGIHEVDVKIT